MSNFGDMETDIEILRDLVREHVEADELLERAREAVEEAIAAPWDSAITATALEIARDLEAYLAEDLVIHIAKEEDVLFPAIQGLAVYLDQVVDEMIEQHDEVRMRQEMVERAVATIEQGHDEVDAGTSDFSAALQTASTNGASLESLEYLLDCMKRLHWILQGHFGDEEDDLFMPIQELLSKETWAELAAQARALDS